MPVEGARSLRRARIANRPLYQWSLLVLQARVALRRGRQVRRSPSHPTWRSRLTRRPDTSCRPSSSRLRRCSRRILVEEAQRRLDAVAGRISPTAMSGTWGEFLRLRGRLNRTAGRSTEAHHDLGQSVSVFELLGERHQAGLSYLELGRWPPSAGARSRATRYLTDAVSIFEALGAAPDLSEARQALAETPTAATTGGYVGVQMDGEDALVRRIVDAAVMPALLAREGRPRPRSLRCAGGRRLRPRLSSGQVRVAASAGCDPSRARELSIEATRSLAARATSTIDRASGTGRRRSTVRARLPVHGPRSTCQRFYALRGLEAGIRSCAARDRPAEMSGALERPLEPLLPGFVCASSAMHRVTEQIQRMQGNDLTVLVTGESGPARISSRGPFTPDRRGAAACFCRITAPARRGSSPTASSLATAEVQSAGRLPISRRPAHGAWRHAVPRRNRRSSTRRPAQTGRLSEQGEVLPVGMAAARRRAGGRRDQRRPRAARRASSE